MNGSADVGSASLLVTSRRVARGGEAEGVEEPAEAAELTVFGEELVQSGMHDAVGKALPFRSVPCPESHADCG
jgi:hypothetical protein